MPQASNYNWSSYQEAIFEFVRYGRGHAFVLACAGSGKTTVIVKSLEFTPRDSSVLFLAFNKEIAKELQRRVPSHVEVRTYHSFGLHALRKTFGKVELDEFKTDALVREVVPEKFLALAANDVRDYVSLAKNNCAETADQILELALHHNKKIFNQNVFIKLVERWVLPVLEKSAAQTEIIDFNDMCWLPGKLKIKIPKYDYVFIDESQDTDSSQHYLVEGALKPSGRLVGVADKAQSIYNFRGASVDAVDKLIKKFKAKILTMPITYRCPTSVVKLAQEIVPEIQAAPNAPLGEVNSYSYLNMLDDIQSSDMVLCRTTAPLVQPCLELLESGQKAFIRGRKIGLGLISIIRKMEAKSMIDLHSRLDEYQSVHVAMAVQSGRPEIAQSYIDDVEAIIAFCNGASNVGQVINKIQLMFSDSSEGVIFSTIHKAKGLEADNVWLLRPDLLPHPSCKAEWELQQEANLKYVAITRARCTLNIVKSGYPKITREIVKRSNKDSLIFNSAALLEEEFTKK